MSPRGPRRGQVNFRSHNSCLPLGASSPGRRRACVLFGVSFRGGYSPTGLPGDTAWLAFPPTGRGRLGVLSQIRHPSTLHGNSLGGCGGQRVLALSTALRRAPTSLKIVFISLQACSSAFACVTAGRVSRSAHVAMPGPLIAHVASTCKINDNRLWHCLSHPEHIDW